MIKEAEMDLEKYKIDQDNATKITVAQLNAYRGAENMDQDGQGIPDPVEIAQQALAERKQASDEASKQFEFNAKIREQKMKKEIEDMVSICKPAGVICKVILETCYLTDEEKETVCRIAKEAGVDFVKTSTGFGTAGATVHDVALMRRVVGPTIGVKAAGGIRDLDSALALIQAGATRLGTSSGIQIVESYKELKKGL